VRLSDRSEAFITSFDGNKCDHVKNDVDTKVIALFKGFLIVLVLLLGSAAKHKILEKTQHF
jgi:hypothetical protein